MLGRRVAVHSVAWQMLLTPFAMLCLAATALTPAPPTSRRRVFHDVAAAAAGLSFPSLAAAGGDARELENELLAVVGRADLGAILFATSGDARVAALLDQLERRAAAARAGAAGGAPLGGLPPVTRWGGAWDAVWASDAALVLAGRFRPRRDGRLSTDILPASRDFLGVPDGAALRVVASRQFVYGAGAGGLVTVSALAPPTGPALQLVRASDVDVVGRDRVFVTPAGAARVIVGSADSAAVAAAVAAEAEAAGARDDGASRRGAAFTISYLSDALRIIRADDGSAAVFSRAARPEPRYPSPKSQYTSS